MRRVAVIVLSSLAFAAPAQAATYYVRPSGDDRAAGTSPEQAWKSVGRVNDARLHAGDVVLFAGGERFADETLVPPASGTTYGAFAGGRPLLAKGVWLRDVDDVTLRDLEIRGADQAILASASGDGVERLTIERVRISGVSIAIHSANTADRTWIVRGNRIERTGDSGMIVRGSDFVISRNTILNTGRNRAIDYGKHGIYAKGPRLRILGNTIRGFTGNGISTRFQDATIEGNVVSAGPIGIAYFDYGTSRGTTRIARNRIFGVSKAGVYVDPSSRESFSIVDNDVAVLADGNGIDVRKVRRLEIARNVVGGLLELALMVERPAGTYLEHHNAFARGRFVWNGDAMSLDEYRRRSGQGAFTRGV